jgi:hypothetical protein
MNRLNIHWSLLRGASLALFLSLSVGVSIVLGSQFYLQEAESKYLRQRAELDGVARLYRTAENDRSLYSQYVTRYQDLERQGVIGDEPRLNWVEALERINQTLRLPVLRYEIQPQAHVSMKGNRYDTKIIRVYRSTMSFDAGLLHEGDLLVLLNELRRQTSGRFEVRDCDVKFASPARGVVFNARQPNLVALCTLDWYTLKIGASAARNEQGS